MNPKIQIQVALMKGIIDLYIEKHPYNIRKVQLRKLKDDLDIIAKE